MILDYHDLDYQDLDYHDLDYQDWVDFPLPQLIHL